MSLETWKSEFCPRAALAVFDAKDALLHSLQKWKGLRAENLERHAVCKNGRKLFDADDLSAQLLYVHAETCALCCFHVSCVNCTLAKSRDHVACDKSTPEEDMSPYQTFIEIGNPEPMIKALEKALEFYEHTPTQHPE